MKHVASIFVALMLSVGVAAAAEADTTVSLVTFYPGEQVYELEGHSALRITTPHYDLAATWGLFDFETPGFVWRFLTGKTDYMMGLVDWQSLLNVYAAEGRRTVVRQLALTSEQKRRVLDLVAENSLPANRVYRYNYVRDNCSTRPLAIVENALGENIQLATPSVGSVTTESDTTWRQMMTAYHRTCPWYQLGIDMVLGSGIDVAVGNRGRAFAPEALDAMIAGSRTADGLPVVASTSVVVDTAPDAVIPESTPWPLHPLTVVWIILAAVILVCIRDWRRRRVTRWVQTLWWITLGLGGCMTLFLAAISTHEATWPNYNLLWLNPLPILIAATLWSRRTRQLTFWCQITNFALVIVAALAWPCLPQSGNAAFVPLMAISALLSMTYVAIALYPTKK